MRNQIRNIVLGAIAAIAIGWGLWVEAGNRAKAEYTRCLYSAMRSQDIATARDAGIPMIKYLEKFKDYDPIELHYEQMGTRLVYESHDFTPREHFDMTYSTCMH